MELALALVVALPPLGFSVNRAGELGMMRHDGAKIR